MSIEDPLKNILGAEINRLINEINGLKQQGHCFFHEILLLHEALDACTHVKLSDVPEEAETFFYAAQAYRAVACDLLFYCEASAASRAAVSAFTCARRALGRALLCPTDIAVLASAATNALLAAASAKKDRHAAFLCVQAALQQSLFWNTAAPILFEHALVQATSAQSSAFLASAIALLRSPAEAAGLLTAYAEGSLPCTAALPSLIATARTIACNDTALLLAILEFLLSDAHAPPPSVLIVSPAGLRHLFVALLKQAAYARLNDTLRAATAAISALRNSPARQKTLSEPVRTVQEYLCPSGPPSRTTLLLIHEMSFFFAKRRLFHRIIDLDSRHPKAVPPHLLFSAFTNSACLPEASKILAMLGTAEFTIRLHARKSPRLKESEKAGACKNYETQISSACQAYNLESSPALLAEKRNQFSTSIGHSFSISETPEPHPISPALLLEFYCASGNSKAIARLIASAPTVVEILTLLKAMAGAPKRLLSVAAHAVAQRLQRADGVLVLWAAQCLLEAPPVALLKVLVTVGAEAVPAACREWFAQALAEILLRALSLAQAPEKLSLPAGTETALQLFVQLRCVPPAVVSAIVAAVTAGAEVTEEYFIQIVELFEQRCHLLGQAVPAPTDVLLGDVCEELRPLIELPAATICTEPSEDLYVAACAHLQSLLLSRGCSSLAARVSEVCRRESLSESEQPYFDGREL